MDQGKIRVIYAALRRPQAFSFTGKLSKAWQSLPKKLKPTACPGALTEHFLRWSESTQTVEDRGLIVRA